MPVTVPKRWRGPLLGLLYAIIAFGLNQPSTAHWGLRDGWGFALLLFTPARLWPWLIGADWFALIGSGSGWAPVGLGPFWLHGAPDVLISAGCIALARRMGMRADFSQPYQVVRILITALAAALLIAIIGDWTAAALRWPVADETSMAVAGGRVLSGYLGMLLLPSALSALFHARVRDAAPAPLARDLLGILLPALIVLVALTVVRPEWFAALCTLALAPVLFFAFRHGWRGAAIALALVSAILAATATVVGDVARPPQARLLLAAAGTAALLFGAAIDSVRHSSERVAAQNARLESVNHHLDRLAQRLSRAARRNLRAEEEQRRHMAAELHDELGQNLTAIQVRVKLGQQRLHEAGLEDVGTSINDIVARMRGAVRRMLDTLRPTILDEFGLARALEEGPIRDLLEAAGIHYEFDLHGDPHALDEDTTLAVYRVAQEAATNAVRHARASELLLRLRVGYRTASQLVLLEIRDNGVGLRAGVKDSPHGGLGLQNMRDRVTALGGVFKVREVEHGTHLHVFFRIRVSDVNASTADVASDSGDRTG